MTITLSMSELAALKPCAMDARRAWFGVSGRKRLDVRTALKAGASTRDILWVAQRLGRKDLCVRFALACAQRVAHLNPDPRVQAALDATQAWLDDPSETTRKAARAAYAYAADAAADAADADAYAAYAAAAYAYAAADAAAADAAGTSISKLVSMLESA